jgi:hypothetical protein
MNYMYTNVNGLKIITVKLLDYLLLMITKVMSNAGVMKKDSLIAQVPYSMIITVVIVKILDYTVDGVKHLKNQNIMLVNLISTGILLYGMKMVLSQVLLLFGLENNGEPCVMTMLIHMEKHLLMLL